MSKTTTNYGLFIAEGTDLFNPLTQTNPTYEKIDTQLKKNADNSVTSATETKTGIVHALVRDVPSSNVIRFVATSNFESGDTFTVDGIVVVATTTSGEQIADGAFIAGNSVIGVLNNNRLTLFVSVKPTSVEYAETAGTATNATNSVNATNATNATLANNSLNLNGISASSYALLSGLVTNSIVNKDIIAFTGTNVLDGNNVKNQIFYIGNPTAISNMPTSDGKWLYLQLYYGETSYLSNLVFMIHLDDFTLCFNGYSSAVSSWTGWKYIHAS